MTPRQKPAAPPEDNDRLAAAIEVLGDRLQIVDDTLTDIWNEIVWVTRNHINLRVINRLPTDRGDPAWPVKQPPPDTEKPAVLSCIACNAEAPLAAGIRNGWTEIASRDDGFIGVCPAHREWTEAMADGLFTEEPEDEGKPADPPPTAKATKTLFPPEE